MYIIYHSLKHREDKCKNPNEFMIEKWYQKEFTIEKFSDSKIEEFKNA